MKLINFHTKAWLMNNDVLEFCISDTGSIKFHKTYHAVWLFRSVWCAPEVFAGLVGLSVFVD
jgi:hypothetical protein